MTDEIIRRGHADNEFIDLAKEQELRRWTESLHVPEETLRDAVQAVGNSAGRVRQYLSYAGSVL